MRPRITLFTALTLAASASLTLSGVSSLAKPRAQDFIIAGHDGYGTQECLVSQSSCGRIVADAWCEAKGFKAAQAYRPAAPDELTGSIGDGRTKGPEAFVITCRD